MNTLTFKKGKKTYHFFKKYRDMKACLKGFDCVIGKLLIKKGYATSKREIQAQRVDNALLAQFQIPAYYCYVVII